MKVDLYNSDGTGAGKQVDLPASIFGVEPNEHLIYQAVITEMTNKRSGTHSAKTRSDVRGGGSKPWRQKGTGRARSGTIRSPIWAGGGVTFPPKPQNYKMRMNKKAKRGARRSAFSFRAGEKKVFVIQEPEFQEPKTRQLAGIISEMELQDAKVLLLTGEDIDRNLFLSARNIQSLSIKRATDASAYDIVNSESVVITESGLKALTESLATDTVSK